jgi:transcriptional regulator with XRE-family HTH domain
MTIGQRVRAARIAAGLSQEQLAERCGVAQAAISRIERGETREPGVLVMAGIARALELSIDELVAHSVRRRPVQQLAERIAALEARVAALEERNAGEESAGQ